MVCANGASPPGLSVTGSAGLSPLRFHMTVVPAGRHRVFMITNSVGPRLARRGPLCLAYPSCRGSHRNRAIRLPWTLRPQPARNWASRNSCDAITRWARSALDKFVRSWSWLPAFGIKVTVIRSEGACGRVVCSPRRPAMLFTSLAVEPGPSGQVCDSCLPSLLPLTLAALLCGSNGDKAVIYCSTECAVMPAARVRVRATGRAAFRRSGDRGRSHRGRRAAGRRRTRTT